MSNQYYNTASLTYEYGSSLKKGFASSNIAVATLKESVVVSASTFGKTYFQNSEIIFIVQIDNNASEEIKNVKVTNDLGKYCLGKGICDSFIVPLTYVDSALLYICGKFSSDIKPETYSENLVFNIERIPEKSSALLIYKTKTNEYSPLASNSEITNRITVSAPNLKDSIESICKIKVRDEADIKIIKNMSPNPAFPGEKINYSFSLYNYGNIPANNVILNDVFEPSLNIKSVFLNSKEVSNSDYSYNSGNFAFPSQNSELSISISSAEFIQDSISGLISIKPGMITITVSGQWIL